MLMQTIIDGTRYKKLYIRKKPEDQYEMYKKAYVNGVQVYSAGNPVTYYVDTGKVYTEEVDYEASCLNPTTFTPAKSGWTFVGWREDTAASGSVLSSKVMGDEPIKLYAIYSQDITCTFKSYGSTQYASGKRYYNGAGVTANASITVPNGADYPGWSWRGWSSAGQTTANTSAAYANGAVITNVSAAFTLYGLYSKPVYLYYVVSGATNNTSGTIYYNAAGSTLYPTLAVANPTISGAVFKGWSVTAGSTSVSYSSLSSGIQLSANATVYAVYTYSNVTLKSGSTSYGFDGGKDQNVITGIDGSKYSAINIGVGDAWVETGRWATVCSARAILRVKTSSGTTYADTILHEMCWESGHWSGEPYQEGTPIRNTTITMNLYPNNVGQMLAVVFDGDAVGGNVYVNTVTAIGKTVVG